MAEISISMTSNFKIFKNGRLRVFFKTVFFFNVGNYGCKISSKSPIRQSSPKNEKYTLNNCPNKDLSMNLNNKYNPNNTADPYTGNIYASLAFITSYYLIKKLII